MLLRPPSGPEQPCGALRYQSPFAGTVWSKVLVADLDGADWVSVRRVQWNREGFGFPKITK